MANTKVVNISSNTYKELMKLKTDYLLENDKYLNLNQVIELLIEKNKPKNEH